MKHESCKLNCFQEVIDVQAEAKEPPAAAQPELPTKAQLKIQAKIQPKLPANDKPEQWSVPPAGQLVSSAEQSEPSVEQSDLQTKEQPELSTKGQSEIPAKEQPVLSVKPMAKIKLIPIDMENMMLEMKRRQPLVMDECHNSGRFKVNDILSQSKNALSVVYRMLIDRNYEVAWCPIYKAGSSTWMYAFAAMGGMLTPENIIKYNNRMLQINELARKAYPKGKVTEEMVELLSKITRFIIVRHPFERILSAYRDKLEHRKGREYYYKKYGIHIVQAHRTSDLKQYEPTFEEFLQFIVETRRFDEHWRPYYIECAPCELNYQFILKTESLDTEQTYFATKFNLLQFLPNTTYTNPMGRTQLEVSEKYYSQIPKSLLQEVYELYEMDFRLFDYSPQQYFDFARDGG